MRPRGCPLVALALLAGCRATPDDIANGPDPLQALAQHVESSRYGPEYWKALAGRDAQLWHKATVFCAQKDAAEYPTCTSVRMVEFLRAGSQPGRAPDSFSFRTDLKPDTAGTRPRR